MEKPQYVSGKSQNYPDSFLGYPLPPPIEEIYPKAEPIVNQPLKQLENPIMTIVRNIPSNPPGLEPLNNTNQLMLQQQLKALCCRLQCKYTIKNQTGENIYYAESVNRTSCCGEQCPVQLNIIDNNRNIVMHLYRRLACNNCCCPCCFPIMEISAPPGQVIGRVQEQWSVCRPIFKITNHDNEIIYRIKGPLQCRDSEFKILSADGKVQIGKIAKQLTTRDFVKLVPNFSGLMFPDNIDVTMKAVLLAACITVDYMLYGI